MPAQKHIKNFLRTSTAAFCVFAFLIQTFSPTFIQFRFELNRAAIVELFCINKDQPELQCEGQCHLTDQLQTDRDNKHEPAGTSIEIPATVLAPVDLSSHALHFDTSEHVHSTAYGMEPYSVDPVIPFHPPRA